MVARILIFWLFGQEEANSFVTSSYLVSLGETHVTCGVTVYGDNCLLLDHDSRMVYTVLRRFLEKGVT